MTDEILTVRQLNRATLSRQMLLARADRSPTDAVAMLAGMQAQEPRPPFIGLWSRLNGFQRDDLLAAYQERRVVRATLMRGTLHTFTAADYRDFRATLQSALTRMWQGLGARGAGIDPAAVVLAAAEILAEGALTFNELRPLLAARFPEADERMLGLAVRMEVPLVMMPTRDRWGFAADSRFGLAHAWLDQPLSPVDRETLVLRYLAAFGPASVADAQTWSGLPGLKATFAALRPRLVVFRDERGREVFDLPDTPRPDPDTPAPVRFLPDFDNLLLSHSDRRRVMADEHAPIVKTPKNLRIRATVLVDGFVAATWRSDRKGKRAVLTVTPFAPVANGVAQEIRDEAEALVRFIEDDATTHEVVIAAPETTG